MAGWGNTGIDKGFFAAAALTKHRAVKLSADQTVTPVTAATDQIIGVTLWSVTAGELANQKLASVRVFGIAEMECSAAITVGDEVGMATNGRAKTAVATERVIGIALQTTANAGETLAVALTLAGHLKP